MRMRLILVVMLATGSVRVVAQNTAAGDAEPRFEAASIRATDMNALRVGGGGAVPPLGVRTVPNGINATLATVEMLMAYAYAIRPYQLVGGPEWRNTDRFDITARAAGQVTPDVARQMMKNLLRDRFNLRARTETREVDVYALVLANSDGRLGPGLTRTSPECEATIEARKKGGAPPAGPPDFQAIRKQTFCGMSMMGSSANGASNYSMGGVTLDRLVSQISGEMRGPAIDRTGLTGLFDILLEYTSQSRQATPIAAPDLTRDVPPPSFRDALQEQLGLRLQIEKGPLEVVVIDSIERPSEN